MVPEPITVVERREVSRAGIGHLGTGDGVGD